MSTTPQINVLPSAPVVTTHTAPSLTTAQKQLLTVQKAKAIADSIYTQMKIAGTAGRDLIAANPYGLTPTEAVEAFNTYAVGGFAGWWPKGAALVDFVNSVVPESITPLPNPTTPTTPPA